MARAILSYSGTKMVSPYVERRRLYFDVWLEPTFSSEHIEILKRRLEDAEKLMNVLEAVEAGEKPPMTTGMYMRLGNVVYPAHLNFTSNFGGVAMVVVSRKTGAIMAHVIHGHKGWHTNILFAPPTLWINIVQPSGRQHDIYNFYGLLVYFLERIIPVLEAAMKGEGCKTFDIDESSIAKKFLVGTVTICREKWEAGLVEKFYSARDPVDFRI